MPRGRALRRRVFTVVAAQNAISEAVPAPVEEAAQSVSQQPAVARADEAPWCEQRKEAWLWMLGAAQVSMFLVAHRRGCLVPPPCIVAR